MAHLHHHPRQPPLPAPDRPDTRAHDPHGPPPHHLLQSSHALQPPHMPPNGMPAVGHSPAPSAHNGPPPRRQEHPHPVAESLQRLARLNEDTWILIGSIAEQMGDVDRSLNAYEHAIRHNPDSVPAHLRVASIARSRDEFVRAIDHWQQVLGLEPENGDVWSALGHCYLMQDDLQKAYAAYQQALYYLPNPKDPKLWYGIGILYDRYGSLEHAEEAFSSVLRMDPDFDKADEIYFRLGIIYKQQQKYVESLDCFDRILRHPPNPLANLDIWFQIGHVYEQQKDYIHAKEAYERVLNESPHHAKVLQQLGWLYHQSGSSFTNQDMAIQYLTKSLESDGSDAQSWYLLGRAYMAVQNYMKAYEAYQQAVYRDGRNPTFWCSIGVLYYNITQFRDALDAYSRAIRINPYISEVWFDLGSLYESCNNQIHDAIDAYARAAELDPNNPLIKQRLALLRNAQANGGSIPAAPGPQDVHPTAYATTHGPPSVIGHPSGAPSSQPRGMLSPNEPRNHSDLPAMNGGGGRDLPTLGPPPPSSSQHPHHHSHPPPSSSEHGHRGDGEPFRGGPPPPLNLGADERGGAGRAHLAPMMDMDRYTPGPPGPGAPPGSSSGSGPSQGSVLLHHPQPQSQGGLLPPPGNGAGGSGAPPTLPGIAHAAAGAAGGYDHPQGGARFSPGPPPPMLSQSREGGRDRERERGMDRGERERERERAGTPVRGRHVSRSPQSVPPPGFDRVPPSGSSRGYGGPPPPPGHHYPGHHHNGEEGWERDERRERERERHRDPRAMDVSPAHSPRSHAGSMSSSTGPPIIQPPQSQPQYHRTPPSQQRSAPYDSRRIVSPPSPQPPQSNASNERDGGRFKPTWEVHSVVQGRGERDVRGPPPPPPPPPSSSRYDPRHDMEGVYQPQHGPPPPHHPHGHGHSHSHSQSGHHMQGPPPPQPPPRAISPDPHPAIRHRGAPGVEGPPPPSEQQQQQQSQMRNMLLPQRSPPGPPGSGQIMETHPRWSDSESPRPGSTRPSGGTGESGQKRKRANAGGNATPAGQGGERGEKEKKDNKRKVKKMKDEAGGSASGKDSMFRTGPSELLKESPPDGVPVGPAPAAPVSAPTSSNRSGRKGRGAGRPLSGSPRPVMGLGMEREAAVGSRQIDEDYDEGVAADMLIGLSAHRTPVPPSSTNPGQTTSPGRSKANGNANGGSSSRRGSAAVNPVSRETDSPHPINRSPNSAHSSSNRDHTPPVSAMGIRREPHISPPPVVTRPAPARVSSIHELTSQGPPPQRLSPPSPPRSAGLASSNVTKRMRSVTPDSDASSKKARTEKMDISPPPAPRPSQPHNNVHPLPPPVMQPRSPGTRYDSTKEFSLDSRSLPSTSPKSKGVNGHPSPTHQRSSSSSSLSPSQRADGKEPVNLPPIATLSHSSSRGSTPRVSGRSGSDMLIEEDSEDVSSEHAMAVDKKGSPHALKVEGRD